MKFKILTKTELSVVKGGFNDSQRQATKDAGPLPDPEETSN